MRMYPRIKLLIFEAIREKYEEYSNTDKDELNTLIFHYPTSMRLSLTGFIVIKSIFTAYSFEMPIEIKTKHRIAMSKFEYPYFFTTSRLILFSEMDASMIKLYGGVENLLEAYYQLDN